MYRYDVKSCIADEFINDGEILDTLKYAKENSTNKELISSIIEKAALCKGLSHREAAVLLDCQLPEENEKIFTLAKKIKEQIYGSRIVMFAPLYLSNYCVNSCVYCPYHVKNKNIRRVKLSQEDIVKEVVALQDMGHKRLALETGEDPVHNPIEYILESIKTIYSIKHKNGAIRRVNVNIAATTVENLKMLVSERIFFFRKLITEKLTKSFILPVRNMITHGTQRRWTEPWMAALMTSAAEFCSDLTFTVMILSDC